MRKSSGQIQDEIFRKMTADEKLAVGAGLWKLGKELAPDKVIYVRGRSKKSSRQDRKTS